MAGNDENNKLIPLPDKDKQVQKRPWYSVPALIEKFGPPALFRKKPDEEKEPLKKEQDKYKQNPKYNFGEQKPGQVLDGPAREKKPIDWKKWSPRGLWDFLIRNPAISISAIFLLAGGIIWNQVNKYDKKSKNWLVSGINQSKIDSTKNKSQVYDGVLEITSYKEKDTTVKEKLYYATVKEFRAEATMTGNPDQKGVLGKSLQKELVSISQVGIGDSATGLGQEVRIYQFDASATTPYWQDKVSGSAVFDRETNNARSKNFKANFDDIKSGMILAYPITKAQSEEYQKTGTIKGLEKFGFK